MCLWLLFINFVRTDRSIRLFPENYWIRFHHRHRAWERGRNLRIRRLLAHSPCCTSSRKDNLSSTNTKDIPRGSKGRFHISRVLGIRVRPGRRSFRLVGLRNRGFFCDHWYRWILRTQSKSPTQPSTLENNIKFMFYKHMILHMIQHMMLHIV